jgi:membrane-bound lytic murein transglycosylase F
VALVLKRFLFLFISGALLLSCSRNPSEKYFKQSVTVDLDSIIKRGRLRAVTDYNSANYFVYHGEPMGFHYELLKAFADHLGVDLELVTENNIRDAFRMLNSGEVDLLAMGLTVTPQRSSWFSFSDPVDSTRQVIVQRKPHGWRKMTKDEMEGRLLRNPGDLSGKSIFVQKGSIHAEWLHMIREKTGHAFTVIEVPFDPETLIQLVDNGEIDYAVCDENIAMLNTSYSDDLDISMSLSEIQNLSWGLRKSGSDQLISELNEWIRNFRDTRMFAIIYNKYYRNSRSHLIVNSEYYALRSGKVSQWDDLIKENSILINWDWRLLASLIYQESRFRPDVTSRAGAYGLMQIMPETGRNFGIDIKASPGNNIRAGIKYINWLHEIFDPKIPDENERTKFILAAYNAGPGHVLDAMKLAEKNGMDPVKWDGNVAEWLQKKSDPRYYNDSLVKNGYFRGKESIAFVNQVLNRYGHYKNIVNEN